MAKATRLQFRISDEKKERFAECARQVGMTETALGEAAIDALCEYIDANGEITMPLALLPKKELARIRERLPFPSTVVFASPEQEAASRLNEKETPLAPRDAAVLPPQPKLTNTRAKLRNLAKKESLES